MRKQLIVIMSVLWTAVGCIWIFASIEKVFAAERIQDDFEYEVTDGETIEIIGYKGIDTAVEIPEEIDGKRVIGIGEKAFERCRFQSVIIPDSVEKIGDDAFYFCTSLKNVKLSEELITIGNRAFSNCRALSEITIPENVEYIGERAFCYCKFKHIVIPRSMRKIETNAFLESKLKIVLYSGSKSQWFNIKIRDKSIN